jgi:biopolymer transport protein ExbD
MRFRHRTRKRVVANFDMTPLIDVVFQLIIFFMLSSTFVIQAGVPVNLPEKSEGDPVPLEARDLIVSIQADGGGEDGLGTIYLEETPIAKDQLTATLLELRQRPEYQSEREPLVLIRADGKVPTQRIIDVMEACQDAEFNSFGIGVATQAQ